MISEELLSSSRGSGLLLAVSSYSFLCITPRCFLCGVKDIRTKSYGSNNPINMVKATIQGLAALRNAEEVAALRGKTVEEILG